MDTWQFSIVCVCVYKYPIVHACTPLGKVTCRVVDRWSLRHKGSR